MSLWSPDTSNFEYYYDQGKYKLAWRLSLLFFTVFLLLALLFTTISVVPCILYSVASVICGITLIVLKKTKKYQFVYWAFSTSASVLVLASFYAIPTIHYPDFIWILAAIIFGFIGLERKYAIMFACIFITGMIVFFTFFLNNHLEHLRIQTGLELIGITIEFLVALSAITYLISEYLRLQQHAEVKLSQTNLALEQQNQIIQQKNAENELLIKEVHHRVKNNLQIVVSLLRMQMDVIENDVAKNQFEDAVNRILAMSLIHQKLYQNNQIAMINPLSYIDSLAKEIIKASSSDVKISFELDVTMKQIGLKTIVPLGLMINELISNSIKHAFLQVTQGQIYIHLHEKDNNKLFFYYNDSGNWIENEKRPHGFGSELIEMLSQQLEGSFTREDSCFKFYLQNID